MTGKRGLNLNIPEKITELESIMKEFLIKRVLYRIIFRGKGLEFDGYRDFSPDDDANEIDWKASMRANKMLVKQYTEERDLKIMFVVDVSDQMMFGSTEKLKCEYAAELSAALAHLIINSGDRVGFIFFSDGVKKTSLPEQSMKQFSRFADELSNVLNYGGIQKIPPALDFVIDYLDNSISTVIFVSDFIRMRKESETALKLISNKFETIALMVRDPLDNSMPRMKSEVIIEDPVTKEQLIIDPSIAGREYEKYAIEQRDMVKKMFDDAEIDFLELSTERSFAPDVANFFKERVERRKETAPIRRGRG